LSPILDEWSGNSEQITISYNAVVSTLKC
jgi:hypothetical protein